MGGKGGFCKAGENKENNEGEKAEIDADLTYYFPCSRTARGRYIVRRQAQRG